MKFTVLFLKKKYIYFTIIAVVLVILICILLNLKPATSTFNTIMDSKAIKADLTGDGNEDILYINTNKDKYNIQVNTKDTSLFLKPDKSMDTVGTLCSYWPMKVTLMDINRNKLSEIFVQATEKNVPVQHMFFYEKGAFVDAFCSNNSLIGFLDCQNGKTPKFVSGKLENGKITLAYYIFVKDKLLKYNYKDSDSFYGKDTIASFINYIQGLPSSEAYKPKDIFYPGVNGNDLNVIGKLSAENCAYKFEDGQFMDTKWNKDGSIAEISWMINFKGTSNKDSKIVKQYPLTLTLKSCSTPDTNFNLKIQSISLGK